MLTIFTLNYNTTAVSNWIRFVLNLACIKVLPFIYLELSNSLIMFGFIVAYSKLIFSLLTNNSGLTWLIPVKNILRFLSVISRKSVFSWDVGLFVSSKFLVLKHFSPLSDVVNWKPTIQLAIKVISSPFASIYVISSKSHTGAKRGYYLQSLFISSKWK